LDNPAILGDGSEPSIGHLFLVGGFAESPVVQEAIREEFGGPGSAMRVIIPQVSAYINFCASWLSYLLTVNNGSMKPLEPYFKVQIVKKTRF